MIDRNRPIVLVDMDGVLFDWVAGFYRIAGELAHASGVELGLPAQENLAVFHLEDAIAEGDVHTARIVAETMAHSDLYATLDPFPGAVAALNEMSEEIDVFVCSTPDAINPASASAKMAAMVQFFGPSWPKRLILTHDKTLVAGRILIDDKPQITGILDGEQSWRQVFYHQPYNADVPGPRIKDWSGWREVLRPLLDHPRESPTKHPGQRGSQPAPPRSRPW